MSDNFDRWLEDELGKSLDRFDTGGYVAPRYLESRGTRRGRALGLLAGIPAVLTTKAMVASAAVVLATGTGVAVTAAANSNSNALNWGQQVKQQVDKCKSQLGADQHGIGSCVSAFARQHGDQQSDQHGQGKGNDKDGSGDDGGATPAASPTAHGQSESHPTPQGKSGSHPTPAPHATEPPHPTPAAQGIINGADGGIAVGGGTGKP